MASEEGNHLHTPQNLDDFPDEWSWLRLEDACDGIIDCPHSTPMVTESGPLMVRTQDILTGVFRADQAAHVSEETYQERVQRAEPQYGDLLYSREGTYFGIAAEVPPNQRVCLGQRMVLLRPNTELVHSRFLRYWLNSPPMERHIHGFRDGTVAQRLNLSTIRALPVLIPPVSTQQAIVCILGTLDDKIELNRRMNETLEATARAIFKSWFVDFDPVWAKAAGQQPSGLAPHIADLFPDAFEASELGEIPKGWEVQPIGDIVKAVGGGTPSTKNPAYWDEGIHCFATPKDLSGLPSPMLLDTERKVTDAGLAKISSGLLPVGTVLLSSRAPVGYLAIAQIPVCVNQGFIAMICDERVSNYYVLNWTLANMPEIKRNAGGTTFAEISKRNFRPILALVPSPEVMTAFDTVVEPLYTKIRLSLEESRTLAALRDILLPRLISGELRVPDAEKLVEAAL